MHLFVGLSQTSHHVLRQSKPHPLLRQRLPPSRTLSLLTKSHLPSQSPSLSLRNLPLTDAPTYTYIIANNRHEDKTPRIAPFTLARAAFHLSDLTSTSASISRGDVECFLIWRLAEEEETHQLLQGGQFPFGCLSLYFKR